MRFGIEITLGVALTAGALWAAPAASQGAEVLWRGEAMEPCRLRLVQPSGAVEVELGGESPRLLGDASRTAVTAEVSDGETVLTVSIHAASIHAATTSAEAGPVVLEAPAACELSVRTEDADVEVRGQVAAADRAGPLEVATKTGDVTLWVAGDEDLAVELATSGETTVDFSVAIDYHRHLEPAKRGVLAIGSGATQARLTSRQGAIRVLRRSP